MKKTLFEIRVYEENNNIRNNVTVKHTTIGENKKIALGQIITSLCICCEQLNIDPLDYLIMVGKTAEARKLNGN